MRPAARRQRGAVTAELALALPVLLMVTLGLVWGLSIGIAQVRVVDAARETARAIARGDAPDDAVARGRQVAPGDAEIVVEAGDAEVAVEVSAHVSGPGGLWGFVGPVPVTARAVAATEGGS